MHRKIIRWTDETVIWEGEAETVRDAIHAAIRENANLRYANLRYANLRYANLQNADLQNANLRYANLRYANLQNADLQNADLRYADLQNANLQNANLRYANLRYANLQNADLQNADLQNADLQNAKNVQEIRLPTGETFREYVTQVVPALLTMGGRSLETFEKHWQCHTWDNCPVAHAFGVAALEEVPILLRPRAAQFVQLFDAGLIPWPVEDLR